MPVLHRDVSHVPQGRPLSRGQRRAVEQADRASELVAAADCDFLNTDEGRALMSRAYGLSTSLFRLRSRRAAHDLAALLGKLDLGKYHAAIASLVAELRDADPPSSAPLDPLTSPLKARGPNPLPEPASTRSGNLAVAI